MTKLRIASDLHLEFWRKDNAVPSNFIMETSDDKNQILVLAGDICPLYRLMSMKDFFVNLTNRFKKVIVVFGNHEFYNGDLKDDIYLFQSFYESIGIIALHNQTYTFDDISFFGATMWSDFSLYGTIPFSTGYASGAMNDFRMIRTDNSSRTITPDDTINEHSETIKHIKKFMEDKTDKKKVIITHHLPSPDIINPRWKDSVLSPAFATNLNSLIESSDINLWVCGHTHDAGDITIGNTRVICNPYGYPRENRTFINKNCVIDI